MLPGPLDTLLIDDQVQIENESCISLATPLLDLSLQYLELWISVHPTEMAL